MPHLSDLIRRYTALRTADVEWLHALLSDWQLLADLSFADLVLWVRLSDDDGWVAVAQMRPTTGPTAFLDDLVELVLHAEGPREPGSLRAQLADKRLLIDRAWNEGRIIREGDPNWSGGVPVREELIPVRRDGQAIAVLQRSTNLSSARTPSRLELTYLQSASDLAQMISEGEFPFDDQGPLMVRSPRVGDGLLRLDRHGRVEYASPNALSAYRRLGLTADLVGAELAPTSLELAAPGEARDESLSWVAGGRAAGEAEIGARGVVVQLRAIPLIVGGTRSGALIMVRDVTELRRRERELLTKDATIREIHHRVKNNLQTVAALLRLQSRRLDNAEGRLALNEAVRRVGAIALVHETLAHAPDEIVDFDDIADRVMEMAAEVSATERPVRPVRIGQFGSLPTMVATPLSMALTELVQNSVEHGLRNGPGRIEVEVSRTTRESADGTDERLLVTVTDDGVGFPEGLDVENTQHLGLQIVRTLVVSELGGKFAVGTPGVDGSAVTIDVPVEGHPLPAPRA